MNLEISADSLEQYRTYLFRYALIKLRDPHLAADAVQETMAAALTGMGEFAGRSSLRSWLTAILKHKIVDSIRDASRSPIPASQLEDDLDIEALFDSTGFWEEPKPQNWSAPDQALEQKRFMEILELCSRLLPPKTAQAFMLREVMGFSVEEICKDLDITPTNCSVMLYRARMSLRACLEDKWFGGLRSY